MTRAGSRGVADPPYHPLENEKSGYHARMLLHLLETEASVPAWVFGLVAFGLLIFGLMFVRAVGKGRPHA